MRRLLLPAPLIAVLAALAMVPATADARSCRGADAAPGTVKASTTRSATLCLLNRQRRRHHLPRLHASASLRGLARAYAARMIAQRFFDHTAPDGTTFLQRLAASRYAHRAHHGYTGGENIGYGNQAMETPRGMVRAWMDSPPHRANILNRTFRDIGIGVVRGTPIGVDGATYVTDFGRRGRR
jgi:uncharacterized protein YkwD